MMPLLESFAVRRMRNTRNIFLIGPMGAGKSTIGRLLAKTLNVDFYDSDREIEQRAGVSIPTIFEYEGEAGFRRRESDILADLTQLQGVVLATGGGAIMHEQNRIFLHQRGYVVYLQCSIDKQLERTCRDTSRPLLKTGNPRETLQALFLTREPYYRALADYRVDTGQYGNPMVIRLILRAYQRAKGHSRKR